MSTTIQNALKLAYIKLIQTGGFDTVEGVQTPDLTAKKQILDAIHEFDPSFEFSPNPYTRGGSMGGTSFHQTTITATVEKLTRLFGQPEPGDEFKVYYEWVLTNKDGVVLTIYDWKEGKKQRPNKTLVFHIGSKGNEQAERDLADYIYSH